MEVLLIPGLTASKVPPTRAQPPALPEWFSTWCESKAPELAGLIAVVGIQVWGTCRTHLLQGSPRHGPSVRPLVIIQLGVVVRLAVLHRDPAGQDGRHVIAHGLFLGLLLPLLLDFAKLNAPADGCEQVAPGIAHRHQWDRRFPGLGGGGRR